MGKISGGFILRRNALITIFMIVVVTLPGIAEVEHAIALDSPVPQVSASVSSVHTNVNSRFSVEFIVTNKGSPSSTDSYLSISISHGLDIFSWSSTPNLPDLAFSLYEIDDLIWNNRNKRIPAEYVLLDVYKHSFDSDESVTIKIVFESPSYESTNEWIKYRAAMLPAGVNYPTDVPTVRDPTSSSIIDQQGYPIYTIDVNVWNPWEDADGDIKENFLDFKTQNRESLLDYGIPEERIYSDELSLGKLWKLEFAVRMHLIAPETEDEVLGVTDWIKEHTSPQDYDFILGDLLDYYIPYFFVIEIDKDVLTAIPYVSLAFHFLPADETYNWVRFIIPAAAPDLLTIYQIMLLGEQYVASLLYSLPCITDGDGRTSYLTGRELLFRFTKSTEFNFENAIDFFLDLALTCTLGFGNALKGKVPLKGVMLRVAEEFVGLMLKLAWMWIKDIGKANVKGIGDFFASLLSDPYGDVDMALLVDGEFSLGSFQNTTIASSGYGEYLGDFPTELMIVYTNQVSDHGARIVLTTQDVQQPERISFSWMSFDGTNLVEKGEEDYAVTMGDISEYGIHVIDDVPRPYVKTRRFNVSWDGQTDWVSIVSNSTLDSFCFSQPSGRIGFSVSGQVATMGFSNCTIPKRVMSAPSASDWTVLLDNNPVTSSAISDNATHTSLYFTYSQNPSPTHVIISIPDLINPIAIFSYRVSGTTVTFDASQSTDNVGIASYEWDFGDGTSGTGMIIDHTYAESGTYIVSLTVKDEEGNRDTATSSTTTATEPISLWIIVAFAVVTAAVVGALALFSKKRARAKKFIN